MLQCKSILSFFSIHLYLLLRYHVIVILFETNNAEVFLTLFSLQPLKKRFRYKQSIKNKQTNPEDCLLLGSNLVDRA